MTITPASIRNNNPGAMYPGRSSKKFGSRSFETLRSHDGVHKIATFPSAIHGAAAQFDLLAQSYCGQSIQSAINKWCGGFYANSYLTVLEDKGGIKRGDELTKAVLYNPETAIPLARAMALQEAGRDFPLDEAGWRAGHQMAFSGATAPAFSSDNDVPSPKAATRLNGAVKSIVAVAAPVAAGGAVVSPMLPAVPPSITESVINATAWKALGEQLWTLKAYAVSEPLVSGGLALSVLMLWFWPKKG